MWWNGRTYAPTELYRRPTKDQLLATRPERSVSLWLSCSTSPILRRSPPRRRAGGAGCSGRANERSAHEFYCACRHHEKMGPSQKAEIIRPPYGGAVMPDPILAEGYPHAPRSRMVFRCTQLRAANAGGMMMGVLRATVTTHVVACLAAPCGGCLFLWRDNGTNWPLGPLS